MYDNNGALIAQNLPNVPGCDAKFLNLKQSHTKNLNNNACMTTKTELLPNYKTREANASNKKYFVFPNVSV